MKRVAMGIAVGSLIFLSMQAFAGDSTTQSPVSKRQILKEMIDCVKKRVSNKTVTYDAAIRSCKDAVNRQEGNSSDSLIASDVPAKR
jgi:hypothetical protein